MDGEGDPNPLAVLSPPHWVINDDDHGGYVIIATWTMMCYMILTVLVRLARKITIGAWSMDDHLICAATVAGLTQSAVLHKSVVSGLGRRQEHLFEDQLESYSKYNYAYQILFILTVMLSKNSLLAFTAKLIPNSITAKGAWILAGISTTWGVATIFGLAFQCKLPTPWDNISGVCHNEGALYYSAAVIDLATDFAITMLPLIALWNVQMQKGPRVTVMAVFMVRIFVCLAEIPRLHYITKHLHSSDLTWSNTNLSIWTQAVANLSIATACIPCLKPFLSSMRSGVFSTSLPAGFKSGVSYTLDSQQNSNNNGTGTSAQNSMSGKLYGPNKTSTQKTTVESGTRSRSESKKRLTDENQIYKMTEVTIVDNESERRIKGLSLSVNSVEEESSVRSDSFHHAM